MGYELKLSRMDWALQNGDQYASELNYIPLPQDFKQRVMATVEQEVQGTQATAR